MEKKEVVEEILSWAGRGHRRGILSKREVKMIQNIFSYMESEAKDIMTHRKNIVALDGEATLEEAMKIILEENNSRFPIYEEDIDGIIGIIHLRDVMKCYFDEQLRSIPIKELKDYIRAVDFVPETQGIDKLFQNMQKEKRHMVVVLDEYGQTEGIVTMEDIIEEIVGNIQDEYDEEEEMIRQLPDGTYMVNGLTQLTDLEELLGIDFEEEDYDTINGYLIDCLDRIPSEEENGTVQFAGYIFHVVSVDNNTIQKIHITKADQGR